WGRPAPPSRKNPPQSVLSDARLARDEPPLPLPPDGFLQTAGQLGQRRFAPHHLSGGVGTQVRGWASILVAYRSYKLVPPLGKRGNEYGLVRLVAQNFSDFSDVLLDHFRIHIGFRPQGFQDFVLGHDPSRVLHQITQHIEGFRGE